MEAVKTVGLTVNDDKTKYFIVSRRNTSYRLDYTTLSWTDIHSEECHKSRTL